MSQFLNDLGYVMLGAAIGYLWHPLWTLLKKIWLEAKKAQEEWHGKSR